MRKILSLLIAVVLGVSTAFATTVYCKMTHSWWCADGAAVAVHYWGDANGGTEWPGVRMTPVSGEEGTWSYDVPADAAGLIFVRVNGSGAIGYWNAQTADLSLPTDDKDLYTITSASAVWSNQGVVTACGPNMRLLSLSHRLWRTVSISSVRSTALKAGVLQI